MKSEINLLECKYYKKGRCEKEQNYHCPFGTKGFCKDFEAVEYTEDECLFFK